MHNEKKALIDLTWQYETLTKNNTISDNYTSDEKDSKLAANFFWKDDDDIITHSSGML